MNMEDEYRVIPGYEGYEVNENGVVRSIANNKQLYQYSLNGYVAVNTFRGAATETLPIHRAVALAWIPNKDPEGFPIVNHKDGNPLNSNRYNLEWVNHSMNNYHAVNNGLRSDNIPCRIRDVESGTIRRFESLAQAAVYMGLSKDAPKEQLFPKRFGWLINGKFELKLIGDDTPWFYEKHDSIMKPARYRVLVQFKNGQCEEYFTGKELLKAFQLYDSPYGHSIDGLVKYAGERFPDLVITVEDSSCKTQTLPVRNTAPSVRQTVKALSENEALEFASLRSCARHFNVDRSVIKNRLNTNIKLDEWTFVTASLISDSQTNLL
jgi:hypothetical protein